MIPEKEEGLEQIKLMKDSAVGEDGVCLIYLMEEGIKVIDIVADLVQGVFQNSGLVIALHKK